MYYRFAALLRTSREAMPIYIAQRVLADVEVRCHEGRGSLVYGLLVGERCVEPKTECEYLVVGGATHAQPNSAASDDEVVANLESLAAQGLRRGNLPLGWYRSVPSIAAAKARETIAFHRTLFGEGWHVMLALDVGASAHGAFIRVEPADGHAYAAPFFELLPDGARAKGGKLGTVVTWANYETEHPVVHLERPDRPADPSTEHPPRRGLPVTLASLRSMMRQSPVNASQQTPQPPSARAAVSEPSRTSPAFPASQSSTAGSTVPAGARAATRAVGTASKRSERPPITFPMLVPPRPPWAGVRSRSVLRWGAAVIIAGLIIVSAFLTYRLTR